MLPIRLGTVNADGPQELFIYTLTRKGRVEATNYRTVRLPGDVNLPVFLKEQGEFGKFYKALFDRQVQREEMSTLFLEYAWDMGWCDPCASDPLSREELRQLGVFWLDSAGAAGPSLPAWGRRGGFQPAIQNVFLTRLHVRYDAAHFPEDLVFLRRPPIAAIFRHATSCSMIGKAIPHALRRINISSRSRHAGTRKPGLWLS